MNIAAFWSNIRTASSLNNSTEATQMFLLAVNSTIREINYTLNPTTDYSEITGVTGTLDVPAYLENALFSGTKYFLHIFKAWVSDPDPEAYSVYRRDLGLAIGGAIRADGTDFLTRNQAEDDEE